MEMKQQCMFGHLARLAVMTGSVLLLPGCQTFDLSSLWGSSPGKAPAPAVAAAASPAPPARPAAHNAVAAAGFPAYSRSGFACCNLRYNADWIGDSNAAQQSFIPLGTPLKVTKIDSYRASGDIGGKAMRLGLDSKSRESLEQWLGKLVVSEDPRTKLARYEPGIRAAIANGQLVEGMNREQVLMAVGYPPSDENPTLDAPYWRYWWSPTAAYYVYWSKSGTVIKIDARAATLARVVYKGK